MPSDQHGRPDHPDDPTGVRRDRTGSLRRGLDAATRLHPIGLFYRPWAAPRTRGDDDRRP